MIAAVLLTMLLQPPAAQPLRLDCSFTGEDSTAPDQAGPRRIGFTVGMRGSRVTSVVVDDPTGIFTSGNVVGSFSTSRGYVAMPREEDPRWRGRLDEGRLTLTGVRREVSLTADPQSPGGWSGRLHYEIGAGMMGIIKDGALTCRPAATAAEGNPQ